MREEDVIEINLAGGHTPHEALLIGYENSEMCCTVLVDDVPALIFGTKYKSIISDEAYVWMLATDLIDKIHYRFLIRCRSVVNAMMKGKRAICNYVWSGNQVSIKWLKWLGFNIAEAQPYGVAAQNFHYFEMRTR